MELYEKVAAECGMIIKLVKKVCQTLFEEIGNELALHDDGKVKIHKFGVFEIRQRKPRKGFNVQTREEIDVPGKKYPAFRPSKLLKEKVNLF